ncbi:MAG: zf-HC2 domain-containing protein [Candidatus Solibacter sp.]
MKAVKDQSAERYLLGEMPPAEAEEFERHYFECQECARAVEVGEIFIVNARALLAQPEPEPEPEAEPAPKPPPTSFWRSLIAWRANPAYAFASVAALFFGSLSLYQGAVQIPRLTRSVDDARVLPAFQLMAASRGDSVTVTVPAASVSFAVAADIPPSVTFAQYLCRVVTGGRTLFNVAAPAPAAGQPITILIPARNLRPGAYELEIYGAGRADGEPARVSTFVFTLEFR